MEHNERADRLEAEADALEKESERVRGEIEDARGDWEAKSSDQSVPGAQPEPDEELKPEAADSPLGEDPEEAAE
jgi:hypothetical protein